MMRVPLSRFVHFVKGLLYGSSHLASGLVGTISAIYHHRTARVERFAWGETHAERVAYRFIPWATCFWIAVIACLLAVSCLSGCVPMSAEKGFGFSHPTNKATINSRTGMVKIDFGKDNKIKAKGQYDPVTGALQFEIDSDSMASSVVGAEGARITESFVAARGAEYQLLAAQTQAMTELGGKALDLVGQIAPIIAADRQAKRDAKVVQQGGPNTQVDAFLGLLQAGLPGIDPGTAAMVDEAVKEWIRIRSGQATPGPVAPVQP